MNSTVVMKRRFRPRWWAALFAIAFAVITIYLGNWQGGRAQYKIDQQSMLDKASAAIPVDFWSFWRDLQHDASSAETFRYRAVNINGQFDADKLLYVDNRIQDGKAGYVAVQLFRIERDGNVNDATKNARYVIVDRGWVEAALDRAKLPGLSTPPDRIAISGRFNLPQSRNPGTFDNATSENPSRINYINIAELSKRFNIALEPYVIEQTAGPGFLGTQRALPAANYEKNRAYQIQWYAFAALAIILFLVLSFRKEVSP
jgi:surfeit locus 1 family protein